MIGRGGEAVTHGRSARAPGRSVRPTLTSIAVLAVGVAGVMLGSIATEPAIAAPTWLSAELLSDTAGNAVDPRVAVDAEGNALAVWVDHNTDGFDYVRARARTADGGWTDAQPTVLHSAAIDGVDDASLQIVVNDSGVAAAVWQTSGTSPVVQGAVGSIAGGWSASTPISLQSENAKNPAVSVDPFGNAVATWIVDPTAAAGDEKVRTAYRPAGAAGAWGEPEDVTTSAETIVLSGTSAVVPKVAVDSGGNALAVWVSIGPTGPGGETYFNVRAAARPAGSDSTWTAPATVFGGPANIAIAELAVNDQGRAVAIWRRGGSAGATVQAAFGSTTAPATWDVADVVTASGSDDVRVPKVAIDDLGNAVAVWRRKDGATVTSTVQAALGSVGGGGTSSWGSPASLSLADARTNSTGFQIAANGSGRVVTTWWRNDASDEQDVVQAAVGSTTTAPAEWNRADDISGAYGSLPQRPDSAVAVDPDGNAVVAFLSTVDVGGTPVPVAEAAAFDGAGPRLGPVDVPTSGTVGERLGFRVSPIDAWSGIPQVAWDFGDGETATGPSVSHTYATAGTYPVQVTATDAVGNETTQTISLTITALPQPPESGGEPPGQGGPQPPGAVPTAPGPDVAPRAVALSGVTMRVLCGQGRRNSRAARRRPGRCRPAGRQKRSLLVSFRASAAAQVKITVTERGRADRRRRGAQGRTVMRETVAAKRGKNTFALPLPAGTGGRLVGEVAAVGSEDSVKVKVRGSR